MLSLTDDNLKLKPENYVKCFYGLFKSVAETSRSMNDWKKSKKLRTAKKKDNKKVDQCSESNNGKPPEIELLTNPSAFAVFSSVRSSILDTNSHINVNGFPSSNYSTLQPPELSDTIDTDSEDEDKISSSYTLPKIVSIGLRSVFTLIRESRTINPQLCIKALNALLDVLQGQLPESLKFEPDDVIDPLFELLLDLATTTHAPELTVVDGNELTSVACACVLSLVVVRGNTGGILTTIAALLKCSKTLAIQNIQMPLVLTSLQKSVEAVLLGNRFIRPDWLTYGIPKKSRIHTFKLCLPTDFTNIVLNGRSFVSNGRYLYLHTNRGLLKIGSGYGGTVNGKLYAHKADFYPNDIGWLGYANNSLYFKCSPRKQFELFELDAETLAVKGVAVLEGRDWCSSVMFSDGNNLGMITAGKDEGFVVRTINTLSNPVTVTSELPLKLARKCVDVFGWALFDEDQLLHTINLNCDDEVALVTAGKEFCILKTISGKLFYTGKGSCLGMKSNTRSNRWLDFSIPKSSKVVHLAAGHDGQHAVLVLEDGNVLFTGISKRGEDGDCSKIRRTLKPVKPKKMLKIEDEFIIDAACNNGSTALVTKKGTLLMFGKDTLYTDPASGVVSELKDIVVRKVALGKAHAAVLTNKGHLWTFGINNKGQCGRDFAVSRNISREIAVVAMETGTGEEELILMEDEEGGDQNDDWKESRGMCSPGQHRWRHRACMVCTICRECTGFGISCLSSILPNQNPKRPGQ